MRKLFACIIFLLALEEGNAQSVIQNDVMNLYFDEVKDACRKHVDLWDYNLYAPILLVDPDTRQVYANMPDSSGILKKENSIYTGSLPGDINIANTSFYWAKRKWAMVLLPLPADVHERLNLISHELFHRAQPYLHFNTWSYTNYQLDKKEGRIYLRLELKALKAALDAPSAKESLKHITDAFIFRKYRNKLFPGTDTTENTLELNEGMAEYTGLMLSDRPEARMKIHLTGKIDDFQRSNSFVRSFPYVTIPAYGYLLSRKDKYWNKKINNQTNLASFFINEFGIQIPDNLENGVEKIKDLYNGKEIEQQESEREEKNKHLIAGYENRFLKQPHLIIPLEKMNYSFDPQTVITLGNEGIYYPTIQLTDNWGILKAENGSLISKDFSRINLTSPTDTTGNVIVGDGWILELKKGYAINKHPGDNNYYLEKNGN